MSNLDELTKQASQSREDASKVLEAAGLMRCGRYYCDNPAVNERERKHREHKAFMRGLVLGFISAYAICLWATLMDIAFFFLNQGGAVMMNKMETQKPAILMNEKDLCELSAEISSVSLMITALSNQVDRKGGDALSPGSFKDCLFGTTRHLDRIANDLEDIDRFYELTERGCE